MSRTATCAVERTPDGRRIVVSRPIDASADAAWRLLTDTHRWPEWGPSIVGVASTDRFVRRGTRGHVRTVGGIELPFRVTECEDRRWTWRVAGVRATGHRVEPVGEGCRVAIEIPMLAAAYALVCRRALATIDRLARDTPG